MNNGGETSKIVETMPMNTKYDRIYQNIVRFSVDNLLELINSVIANLVGKWHEKAVTSR